MRKPETFRLSGTSAFPDAASRARAGNPITLQPHPKKNGWYQVIDQRGECLGLLSNKHPVAQDLAGGQVLLHGSVNCINSKWNSGDISITMRLVTGELGDAYPVWSPSPDRIINPDTSDNLIGLGFAAMATFRGHKVELRLTGRYQDAIGQCAIGDHVNLMIEPDNMEDDRAVAAFSRGQKIGYLPDSGWLKGPIIDKGVDVTAVIRLMPPIAYGGRGVVLDMAW